jgi:hypothetical protein
MPLFLTPGVGTELGPPDPIAQQWKGRIDQWAAQLKASTRDASEIAAEADALGLRAMPIRDQMDLQWTFIVAGLDQVVCQDD